MQSDVCILAKDEDLTRMLALELAAADRRVLVCHDPASLPAATLCLLDADAFPDAEPPCRTLRYTRADLPEGREGEWLSYPFRLAELADRLFGTAPRGLALSPADHAVFQDGCKISLTPREYALFAALYEAGGEPLSREELYRRVFPACGEGDGVVNVYMHYLRRKLEADGRRVLVAVRGRGYALRKEAFL